MTIPDTSLGPLPAPPASPARRLAAVLHRHPRVRLGGLLAAPLGWMVVAYVGSLVLFFISSFWTVDSFSGNLVTTPSLDNYVEILTTPVYRTIAVRTVVMAALVTLTDDPARVPHRLLHGQDGLDPDARDPRRVDPAAAVVRLPRQGLRVAAHPERGRRAQRRARAVRDPRPGLRRGGRVARRDLPLAAVHDHPAVRGPRARARARSSRRRATSARGAGRRSGG